ncbi:MAG: BglG family transcription antiterminator [Suipraeoptans sp.]
MNHLPISLRQRKLLHYIQNRSEVVTGAAIAKHLNVTTRTVRNDIRTINDALESFGISIKSLHSKGYFLDSKNKHVLKDLNQTSNSFLFREDRVRHIVFLLCTSDAPLNLDNLEEEMYISRTTLEHDLIALKNTYTIHSPRISLHRHKNHISFSKDERKIRVILNKLFADNWNYNARGNTYYKYQFLEETVVNLIMDEVKYYLNIYNILLEDINIVCLNLAISIMYHRITDGYELTDTNVASMTDSISAQATIELLNSLEEKLNCNFSEIELKEIYLHISCGRLLNAEILSFENTEQYIDTTIIHLAWSYIETIKTNFNINLSDNEDFYITLLQYLRYLSLPIHFLNDIDMHNDITRTNLLISLEIAYLFQPLAKEYYNHFLDYTELMYLAFCISGALAYSNRTSPKLKTVIMSHLNTSCAWNIKHNVLSRFDDYIELKTLLPVYMKDYYDFSDTDLVLTTANKMITNIYNCRTITISPFFTVTDQENIDAHIVSNQIKRYYASNLPALPDLFETAFWHKNVTADGKTDVINMLANDFISNGIVSEDYLQQVLQREMILSYACKSDVVIVYSLIPAKKTCLSIACLDNKIKWNGYKINTVISVALKPDDTTLVLKLLNQLYTHDAPYDISQHLH